MKRLIFTFIVMLIASIGWAQIDPDTSILSKGRLEISAFGGLSAPQGKYKGSIGRAKDGYFSGLVISQYFKGNKFGLGLDARFLNHDIRRFDSVFFNNGHTSANYVNHPSFQHIAVSFGPSYKHNFGRLDIEAYGRGGMMFQGFPQYTQSVFINQAVGPPIKMFDVYSTNNPKRITKSWMGLAGLRAGYAINKTWSVFFQIDYLKTFGKRLGGDSSEFHISRYNQKKELTASDVLLVKDDLITNLNDYYEEMPVNYKAHVQSINMGLGVKYTFGSGRKSIAVKPKDIMSPIKTSAKEILVVVKDKQTGLALGGVTLTIKRSDAEYISISNANGEAERVVNAVKGQYIITAVKNGISAEPVAINEGDFKGDAKVIYKEIYHDDPRFTLIGETIDAAAGTKLPGISTVLTNTGNNSNIGQTSDGEAKFVYQLEQKSEYAVVANQAGRFSQTESVTTVGLDRSKTLYVSLKLGINKLDAGAVFVLRNIHYDFDKFNIRTDAGRILDNLVNVMRQNQTLKIELSSHTDSRGKDDYNLSLSQKRAQAAVDYLVSKGIDRSRLEAKGYGETRLLNKCANGVDCSDEEHQANRRTEIKVLKY